MTKPVEFPFDRWSEPIEPEPSLIQLTPAAAERIRGRYVDRPFHDGPGATADYEQDRVDEFDSLTAEGVQLLPNGWIRAYVSYSHRRGGLMRVDLLLAPGEVTMVTSGAALSSPLDEHESERESRQKMAKALQTGWRASSVGAN